MATPNFSAKLPDVTMRQLKELSALFGTSMSQVVILAVRHVYQQEIERMHPVIPMTKHEGSPPAEND